MPEESNYTKITSAQELLKQVYKKVRKKRPDGLRIFKKAARKAGKRCHIPSRK
jgi:hypothetical protein